MRSFGVRRRGTPERRDQVVGVAILIALWVAAIAISKAMGADSRRAVLATFGLLVVLGSAAAYGLHLLWDLFKHRSDRPGRHSRD